LVFNEVVLEAGDPRVQLIRVLSFALTNDDETGRLVPEGSKDSMLPDVDAHDQEGTLSSYTHFGFSSAN
jgi:hypothetical protein